MDAWTVTYVLVVVMVAVGDPVCGNQMADGTDNLPTCHPVLAQVNYDTLYLAIENLANANGTGEGSPPVDLMILMRS